MVLRGLQGFEGFIGFIVGFGVCSCLGFGLWGVGPWGRQSEGSVFFFFFFFLGGGGGRVVFVGLPAVAGM